MGKAIGPTFDSKWLSVDRVKSRLFFLIELNTPFARFVPNIPDVVVTIPSET